MNLVNKQGGHSGPDNEQNGCGSVTTGFYTSVHSNSVLSGNELLELLGTGSKKWTV
jgi:hypothetical protein